MDDTDGRNDKDALDVYRLLHTVSTEDLVDRFKNLRQTHVSRGVTEAAIQLLPDLFGSVRSAGTTMALRAASPLAPGSTMAASLVALIGDLMQQLERSP